MRRSSVLHVLALLAALTLLAAACEAEEDDAELAEEAEEEPEIDEDEDDEEEDDEPETDDVEVEDVDAEGLVLGYLLPETGDLAFLGDGMINAVQMAVEDMNDAGGVLDEDVALVDADEGDEAATVQEGTERLLGSGVHGIIGAAASGQSLNVLDTIVGSGVAQCSGSNTAPTFTDIDDEGLYWRFAPSDALQGPVLADRIVADGHVDVAIMARADDYGQGLADATAEALDQVGANVAVQEIYDQDAATFDAEVAAVEDAGVDAVVIVSFEEGVTILQDMIEAGLGPDEVGIYGADGIADSDLNESVDPGDPNVIDGMAGTEPDPAVDDEFLDRLDEYAGGLEATAFSPQTYDCAITMGLGALISDSTDGADVAAGALEATEGDTECTSFGECAELLEDGESIAYRGPSGVSELSDVGDPVSGQYRVWAWEDGEFVTVETVEATLEEAGIED